MLFKITSRARLRGFGVRLGSLFLVMQAMGQIGFSDASPGAVPSVLPEKAPIAWQEDYLVDLKAARFRDVVATYDRDAADYQIGNEWGKKKVTAESLQGREWSFVRAAMATGYMGGGTVFYIGKINGHHMVATNYHVFPSGRNCAYGRAFFPLLKKTFSCEKFYGNWKSIDLALFSIRVQDQETETLLAPVGRNFNFEAQIYPGQQLVTIGFGSFRNPGQRNLMANEDGDCKTFSGRDEFRFMTDPDQINPADYKAWSFAVGCDVSHGDSGSAMVDRTTGDVIGLVWTAATPKPREVQDSNYLDGILRAQAPEVWTRLSYAVPAPAIKAFLSKALEENPPEDADTLATIGAVLSSSQSQRFEGRYRYR